MKKGTWGMIGTITPITPTMKKTPAQRRFRALLRGLRRLRPGFVSPATDHESTLTVEEPRPLVRIRQSEPERPIRVSA